MSQPNPAVIGSARKALTVRLLVSIPHVLLGAVLIALLALVLGGVTLALAVTLTWLLSGLLIFVPGVEEALAHSVFGMRRPTPPEAALVDPAWTNVRTAISAGLSIDTDNYSLWIEDEYQLDATAAAGHIVGVTGWTLANVSPRQLEAVIARAIGSHVGGFGWSTLLAYWYALPGKWAVRLIMGGLVALRRVLPKALELLVTTGSRATTTAQKAVDLFGYFMWGFLLIGTLAVVAIYALPVAIFIGVALGASKLADAGLARQQEVYADQFAIALGYQAELVELIAVWQRAEQQAANMHAAGYFDQRATSRAVDNRLSRGRRRGR